MQIAKTRKTQEMLMISKIKHDEGNITLKLDGKIEGVYLYELEEVCKRHLDGKKKTVTLDFSGVTFIDDGGLEALSKLRDGRLKIIKCSPFIRTLLNDLTD
jgi:anti-anti-sigma regulatory factor